MSELNPNSGVSSKDDKTKTQRVIPSLKDNFPSPNVQDKNKTNSSFAGSNLNRDRSKSEINNMKSPISSGGNSSGNQKKGKNQKSRSVLADKKGKAEVTSKASNAKSPKYDNNSSENSDEAATKAFVPGTGMFGRGGPVIAFGGDVILRSICDWTDFEAKCAHNKDLAFPYHFLSKELLPNEWNNIPIPICEAFEIIKKTFSNTENLIIQGFRQNKLRSEAVVRKFKDMKKDAEDREERLKKNIEILHRKQYEALERQKVITDELVRKCNEKLDETIKQAGEDRLNFNKRIALYTPTDKMNSFVRDMNEETRMKLQEQVEKNLKQANERHETIYNENLLIPGVIGEHEEYRNLKMYLLDRKKIIKATFDKNARDANNQAADQVAQCRVQLQDRMKDIEKSIKDNYIQSKKNLNSMKTDLANETKMMQGESNDKLKKIMREMDDILSLRKKDLATFSVDYVKVDQFEESKEVMKLKFKVSEQALQN